MLLSVFSRYGRGQATNAENAMVEKFYEAVPDEPLDTERSARIGMEMKSQIDSRLKQQGASRRLPQRWAIAAAACLALGFLIKIAYEHPYFQGAPDTLPQHISKSGASLKMGHEQFHNLEEQIPEGSFFQIDGRDTVLNLGSLQADEGSETVTIENRTAATFALLLADGTKVALYKSARITFKSPFRNEERVVQVSGKAAFDVETQSLKGQKMPFRVETGLQAIDVLGTQFTVDANLEAEESIFLTEGSVRLTHRLSKRQVTLSPGQHAFLASEKEQIFVTEDQDPQKVTAWRKELFYFEDQPLHAVIHELSQWYGVAIRLDHHVSNLPITGTFSRYRDVRATLDIIEMTNNISCYEKKGVFYVNKK